jgi:hypothetical protein
MILGDEKFDQKKTRLQIKEGIKTPFRHILSLAFPYYDPARSRTTATYVRRSFFSVKLADDRDWYHVQKIARVDDVEANYLTLVR